MTRAVAARALVLLLALGAIDCATAASTAGSPSGQVAVEAGFLEIPPRQVVLKGQPVSIEATARLFYNFRPAAADPEAKPIFFLFNGFAAELVRAYGTGPTQVVEGGAVVANQTPFTAFANLVYVEPRQSGYSYDLIPGKTADLSSCAPSIFNEYVDAADVLLGALTFLDAHPQLRGPVYWVGESYAGVRITWILAYLRGRWDLASYEDPTLLARLAETPRATSLHAGEILLEGWLAGGAHTTAIAAECADPSLIAGVAASTGVSCAGLDACACAGMNDRSPYNYTYSIERETTRESEASAAHIFPDRAAALLGVPLETIPLLAAAERAKGFKCSPPDDTVPAEDALVAALGPLPAGQAYYVPYSPLLPGKEVAPTTADWSTQPFEGLAFVDNLHDVPTFLTAGARDLVVPTAALAPALRALIGAPRVDTSSVAKIGVTYADGERSIDVFAYPDAGHMIEMIAPAQLASDVRGWLAP